MRPIVSILMPAYNVSKYIDFAIDSILKQTYINFELLILDDGSKDNTWELLSRIKDERIKLFRFENNKGNIVALNFLLIEARGNFITFQDADDWSHENRIHIQIDFFKKNPNIYLCGTFYSHVESDGTLTPANSLPVNYEQILKFIDEFECPPFCAASCMIRRAVYDNIGGLRDYFNRIGSGDFDWHYRILEKFETANISQILYFYRKNISSLTSTVSLDLKKMISTKIAYHLHIQRKLTGTDSIYSNTLNDLEELTKKLLPNYYVDPKLIYYKIAENQILNNQLRKGFFSILICIWKKPFKKRNFNLLKMMYQKLIISSN